MAKAQQKKEETANKTIKQEEPANLPNRRTPGKLPVNQSLTSPFTLMRHIAEDMENMMLSDFGFGSRFRSPFLRDEFFSPTFSAFETAPFFGESEKLFNTWSPQVEMFECDGKLVVQADLPGIKKDDVKVEVTDQQLTIEGERKDEREEKGEGFYRSERSYGSFCRQIALPEGVNTENAKAEFKNGVLEISMESPQLESGKKRLEISEG